MFRKIVFIVALIASFCAFSQSKSFVYEFKFKPNSSKDSLKTETAILDIDKGKSIFRLEKEKSSDSLAASKGIGSIFNFGFTQQFRVEKNLEKNEVLKLMRSGNDLYSLKIDDQLNWKILPEKTKIGDFNCQKATANYGGRNWTAWFTNEIPLQEGPYIFRNLPGLIVEISDDAKDFSFKLTQIKKFTDLYPSTQKPIALTWKSFEKLQNEFYNDPYKDFKPNSAGKNFEIVKFTDEHGNVITPDFNEWSKNEQKRIRETNNPIELNHKINYK